MITGLTESFSASTELCKVHGNLNFLFLKFLLIFFYLLFFGPQLVKTTCNKCVNKVGSLYFKIVQVLKPWGSFTYLISKLTIKTLS
jgi:hypothetical protein